MINNEKIVPPYYDGSIHMKLLIENFEIMVLNPEQQSEQPDIEKCRHLLGGNPY